MYAYLKVYIICFFCLQMPYLLMSQTCNVDKKTHYNYADIKIILDKNNCNDCHHSNTHQPIWSYDTYAKMFSNSGCEIKLILAGNPGESLLIDKINGGPSVCGNAMPLGRGKMNDADLLAIESWVGVGAPEGCISDFQQIKQILNINKCGTCHNSSSNNTWKYDNYQDMFIKPSSSSCPEDEIIKFNAEKSLLYLKMVRDDFCGTKMTADGVPVKDDDLSKIRDWINAGAPESAKSLPVTLKDFRTENIRDERILLYWKTASELNTSHFDIEVSTDGIHFSFVSSISSTASVGDGQLYSYEYNAVRVGYQYFRIKIVDYDLTYTYTPVRVERISNNDEIFSVYPNPVWRGQQCIAEWYPLDEREKVRLLLMDFTGRLCREYLINSGTNYIDLDKIRPGLYYFSIEDYQAKKQIRKVLITD